MAINQQPVTLPRFDLTGIDIEAEAKEAAERITERRVIREGRDAWAAIGQAESLCVETNRRGPRNRQSLRPEIVGR